jgi:nucleotide-binding universal stress UspA family protein
MAERAPDQLSPTCILAMVAEDGSLEHVRRAALQLAARKGARLILWDSSTASSFTDPMPSELLGRPAMAKAVIEAREAGVEAWARLALSHGADVLAGEARSLGADLIVLPEELDDPGMVEKLRGETVEKARDQASVPVVVVDRSGAIR